jgi:hypothetical protein
MEELFDFLSHSRLDVRNEAVKIVAGSTGQEEHFEHFKAKFRSAIRLTFKDSIILFP